MPVRGGAVCLLMPLRAIAAGATPEVVSGAMDASAAQHAVGCVGCLRPLPSPLLEAILGLTCDGAAGKWDGNDMGGETPSMKNVRGGGV